MGFYGNITNTARTQTDMKWIIIKQLMVFMLVDMF